MQQQSREILLLFQQPIYFMLPKAAYNTSFLFLFKTFISAIFP